MPPIQPNLQQALAQAFDPLQVNQNEPTFQSFIQQAAPTSQQPAGTTLTGHMFASRYQAQNNQQPRHVHFQPTPQQSPVYPPIIHYNQQIYPQTHPTAQYMYIPSAQPSPNAAPYQHHVQSVGGRWSHGRYTPNPLQDGDSSDDDSMMLPFYQNIQPPAHLDSPETDNYINLCNRLSELEERTNLIESEHVHTAIQISDMDNERIVYIIKREVIDWKKSIDHLDKTRHLVKGVFPKLVHVLSMDSGRLTKVMVKRAKDISYLSRNSLKEIQKRTKD